MTSSHSKIPLLRIYAIVIILFAILGIASITMSIFKGQELAIAQNIYSSIFFGILIYGFFIANLVAGVLLFLHKRLGFKLNIWLLALQALHIASNPIVFKLLCGPAVFLTLSYHKTFEWHTQLQAAASSFLSLKNADVPISISINLLAILFIFWMLHEQRLRF